MGEPLRETDLAAWRERERQFPKHTQRMTPDGLDRIPGGAWDRHIASRPREPGGYNGDELYSEDLW